MSGANIGTAYMTVSPRFSNLGKSVNDALGSVDTTSSGVKMGRGVSEGFETGTKGLATSGALMGVFGAITSKAMDMISSSVSGAASRMDTLNNYPRDMQALGYSADDAQSSISKMSEHLTGLPTALDDMTSTVQGISAITGDLSEATDVGLALNDMLLASGTSTGNASLAAEQFRQILSRGTPDLQSWRSLTTAMPGQMKQLADNMLGAGSSADDLYTALGGGGAEATITTQQLMDAMVEMDSTSTDSFTNFSEQAKNATGGVQTSFENMKTHITRGLADVLDSIGTDTIKTAANGVGTAFEGALNSVGDAVSTFKPYIDDFMGWMGDSWGTISSVAGDLSRTVMPAVTGMLDAVEKIGPKSGPAIAGLLGLAGAFKGINALSGAVSGTSGVLSAFGGVAKTMSSSLGTLSKAMGTSGKIAGLLGSSMGGPLVLGIMAAVAAIGFIVSAVMDANEKSEDYRKSTEGLSEAVERSIEPVEDSAGAYDSLNRSVGDSATSIIDVKDRLEDATQAHMNLVDSINSRTSEMQSNVGLLQTYRDTIAEYADKSDLSTTKQAELKIAVDGVNEACGTQYKVVDAAQGKISDENGVIQENTDKINDNIDARINQLKSEALQENYKDLYKQQIDDLKNLKNAQDEQATAQKKYDDANAEVDAHPWWADYDAMAKANSELNDANKYLDDAKDKYDYATDAMGDTYDAMVALGSGASTISAKITSMGSDVAGTLDDMGLNVDELSSNLMDAGVSADDMKDISSADFNEMLKSCGGDIESLSKMISAYNMTPIANKDGSINIDSFQLSDAQGMVYTWNGSELLDKDGNAAIDGTSLIDSQGNLWTWNDSSLYDKNGHAWIDDGVPASQENLNTWNSSTLQHKQGSGDITDYMSNGIEKKNEWNESGLSDWVGSGTINIVKTVSEFFSGSSGNAAGGFRLNAAGGYRYHGSGAIATRAVPLDIVGEDGAEAIVPLTNRKYSLPFAKTLADQMESFGDVVYNIRIGDITYNDDSAIGAATKNYIQRLVTLGAM